MSSRKETLAQLKAARAGGGRSKQYQGEAEDQDLYDTVDEEEYKDLVKNRLQRDDFIEDDDGSGYVDDGREETWGGQRDEDDEEDDEEDPEERRKRRAAKKAAKAKAKPSKPIPRPPPPPSANAYRPVISETKEDDFMSSLLSGMEEERPSRPIIPSSPPPPFGRKRKSSPDLFQPSSDGIDLGSDESYLGRGSEWGLRAGPSSTSAGASGSRLGGAGGDKRAKLLDKGKGKGPATKVKVEEDTVKVEDLDGDVGMDMQGSPDWPEDLELPGGMDDEEDDIKPTIDTPMFEMDDDDEDDLVVKPSHKPSGSSSAMGPPAKRKFVNATSVSLKSLRPPPSAPSTMKPLPKHADPDEDVPATPAWESLQDSLLLASDNVPGSDDLPPSSPPPPSRAKAAAMKGAPATTDIDAYESDGTTLRMYWLDYFEQEIKTEDSTTKNLYLFGKVFDRRGAKGKWVSCCLKIDGMERNLFVCPRPKTVIRGEVTDLEPSQSDVQSEFGRIRRENGVSSFMSKWVKRNYVFGVDGIPTGESDWLKVIYGFDEPALPLETSGNTFGHILGTNTSAFETLVLKRKIMGPCWLEIKDAVVSGKGVSWCKLEVTVDDPKKIRPLSETDGVKGTPPLTIMSIAARTIVNHKANDREVVCVSARVWENSNIDDPTPLEKQVSAVTTIVRPLGEFPPGFVQKCQTEKSKIATVKTESMLLNNLVANIQRYDPDVLVGHDFLNGSLEAILERMGKLKTEHWSRFGRFKRKGRPPASNKFGGITALMSGRLACDLSGDGSKSMIPSTTWSLTEMCKSQLKIDRQDIDPEDTHTYFDNTVASPMSLLRFVRHCEVDTFFQMAIASKVQILPLTKQLTTLAGNAWNRTLNGGRAERNEYILLHEFHRLKYICPDTFKGKNKAALIKAEVDEDGTTTKTGGKRDKFKGGLVFEPKRGLWDKYVLVMDFNSLYPSIIQEYNIDFTTLSVVTQNDADGEETIPDVPSTDVPQGVLPRIIAQLVNRRREVKNLMKSKNSNPILMNQWEIRQLALKLTANSMYGCLGFEYSRFYARPLAALTTFKGREILTSTKELAESVQLEVVYGDTDSVFVNSNVTDYGEAIKMANVFKKQVNDKYRLLEIDLDAVFQRLLLLQKKKYAAIKVGTDGTSTQEVKGLDMKRREYCDLSKNISKFVLDHILSGEATELCIIKVHDYLTEMDEKIRGGKIPLEDFIINKRLGKNPEDYPDAKSQPQVQVALRIKARGGSAKSGDVMQYIFCLGADGKAARTGQADRAYHPDEIRKQPELKIDYEYYLAQQILPPIERLCDPIEGTDKARLAECLGLDAQRYAPKTGGDVEREFNTLGSQMSDKERFQDCDPFEVRCSSCDFVVERFGGLLDDPSTLIQPHGLTCSNCLSPLSTPSLAVQLELQIRARITKYYKAVMICDDSSCQTSTRAMGVYGRRCMATDCKGHMNLEYTDEALYKQLLYYISIFDTAKAVASSKGSIRQDEIEALAGQNKPTFDFLRSVGQKYLDQNGRGCVELRNIFSFMSRNR
ncbi:hypothetical protein BDY24DRAFT_399400 [Mrakia frigida]|uniref:DNA-directed DNA polymerase alpha catalytic subunit POL1 n=1 Tax=Mrakia frigida TaxID=29902 RepID=UPI003FCC1A09